MSFVENITWKQQKWWRSMKIDSRGRRGGLTPFILLPRTLLLTAPPLLAPRCAAKLVRIHRESSLRRPAPSSLVVLGGAVRRDEREGEERGKLEPRSFLSLKPIWFLWETIDIWFILIILKNLNWPIKIGDRSRGVQPNKQLLKVRRLQRTRHSLRSTSAWLGLFRKLPLIKVILHW